MGQKQARIVLNEYCLYEESLECFRENYEISRQVSGDAQKWERPSMINMGHVLNNMERYADAQMWLEKCILLEGALAGPRWRLGVALMKQGELDEAESLLYEALEDLKKRRG